MPAPAFPALCTWWGIPQGPRSQASVPTPCSEPGAAFARDAPPHPPDQTPVLTEALRAVRGTSNPCGAKAQTDCPQIAPSSPGVRAATPQASAPLKPSPSADTAESLGARLLCPWSPWNLVGPRQHVGWPENREAFAALPWADLSLQDGQSPLNPQSGHPTQLLSRRLQAPTLPLSSLSVSSSHTCPVGWRRGGGGGQEVGRNGTVGRRPPLTSLLWASVSPQLRAAKTATARHR